MIAELGHFALILALALALVQGLVPFAGAASGRSPWLALAVPAARMQAACVALSFGCLSWCFAVNDFSVLYVASNSNSALPLQFRLAAVWGAHEGSLLLWILVLAGWTVAVTFASASLAHVFRARLIAVLGLLSVGFLLFTLFTSNPFERLLPAAAEGRDLNPLLQDPGLIIHPPMLYMGYVGTAVPFAFAIAALLEGRIDLGWARWTRPWALAAWVFLTLGITLGSWWAYYELGWGGWWFWDPVENASFMPWLVTTALIHSLAVTEKRGAFRAWTVLLAITALSLSLLGTFLVRSGVLVSVHAFATDPARGVFILIFMSAVVGLSLLLYAARAARVSGGGTFALLSRETLLLANNVLLAAAAATVLIGTLYPLLVDALDLGKISVGPPYFDAVFVPLMLPLAVLLGLGPLTRWRSDEGPALRARVRVIALVAAVAGVVAVLLTHSPSRVLIAAGLASALWVAAASVQVLVDAWRGRGLRSVRQVLSRAQLGMALAHVGVAVFIVGVTAATAWDVETDVSLRAGATHASGRYTLRFDGVTTHAGPNYDAERATLVLLREGREIERLHPEKRRYRASGQTMTEAAIDAGFTRDLYVALGAPLGDGAWSVRIYVKPLVRWIWGGALLMALGGLLAASDRRYRLPVRVPAAVPAHAQARAS